MWKVSGQTIKMTKGDYGIDLPITINGVTFSAQDSVLFTLKTKEFCDDMCECYPGKPNKSDSTIITKSYSNISNNTINLSFTKEESDKLYPGDYLYSLDWYQDGLFLCNIIPAADFKVVDKA